MHHDYVAIRKLAQAANLDANLDAVEACPSPRSQRHPTHAPFVSWYRRHCVPTRAGLASRRHTACPGLAPCLAADRGQASGSGLTLVPQILDPTTTTTNFSRTLTGLLTTVSLAITRGQTSAGFSKSWARVSLQPEWDPDVARPCDQGSETGWPGGGAHRGPMDHITQL
ncbi:hypothetical protein AUP68_14426 [Ilyonectria robusta]